MKGKSKPIGEIIRLEPEIELEWMGCLAAKNEGGVYVTVHVDGWNPGCFIPFSDFGLFDFEDDEATAEEQVEKFCADLDAVKAVARAALKGKAG